MKLEDQVVCLELARKLKELGVKQDSYFWWGRGVKANEDGSISPYPVIDNDELIRSECSAFTVAELGEMLPQGAQSWMTNNGWACELWKTLEDGHVGRILWASTEADVRAKMLVYILENNLFTI